VPGTTSEGKRLHAQLHEMEEKLDDLAKEENCELWKTTLGLIAATILTLYAFRLTVIYPYLLLCSFNKGNKEKKPTAL